VRNEAFLIRFGCEIVEPQRHRNVNACLNVSSPFEAALLLAKMTLIGAAVVVPSGILDGVAGWHVPGHPLEAKMPRRSAIIASSASDVTWSFAITR
jgi:hypothetical protein